MEDRSLLNLEIRDVADGEADMTKIVIKIHGVTGSDVYHLLDEKRINIEKYTQQSIIVTIHSNINEQEIRHLAKSLIEIGKVKHILIFL